MYYMQVVAPRVNVSRPRTTVVNGPTGAANTLTTPSKPRPPPTDGDMLKPSLPARPMSSSPSRARTVTVGKNMNQVVISPRAQVLLKKEAKSKPPEPVPIQQPRVFVAADSRSLGTSQSVATGILSGGSHATETIPEGHDHVLASQATSNVYHAMVSRKNAEETARQLARRISHFRAQEERVLREVQDVKNRLEAMLSAPQAKEDALMEAEHALPDFDCDPKIIRPSSRGKRRTSHRATSREQLDFLMKQKRVMQIKKLEAAREDRLKRKAALELQKQKQGADFQKKQELTERIRSEEQKVLEDRAAKQHQLLESLEDHHQERLRKEKEREHQVMELINEMREEEKNLAMRLQALRVHQDYIKRGLKTTPDLSSPVTVIPQPTFLLHFDQDVNINNS